jgi:hypothetical protein
MSDSGHHWISLHHVRFPSAISASERTFPVPTLAECWRFCPSLCLGEDGLPTWISDTWCGFGIYDSREDAEATVTAVSKHLPFLSEAVGHWDALLLSFEHHGAVNWRGTVQHDCAIRPASAKLDGPLAVITSTGFNPRSPDQVPRIVRFVRGVRDVLEFYGTARRNVRRDAFSGGFDGRDGFTVSLWPDVKAMMEAVYGEGTHRTLMDLSRDGSWFDRSSFTRARIILSRGNWDGDPFEDMA